MSNQALARQWRPNNFSEVSGQEHVLRALANALNQNRLHHAYLFSGTRGVGKTTIARILAKCLNCERGISDKPCGTCRACREIAEGRFIDLIEVDAASRTKVEDTRELLENIHYLPAQGRFKIYLIDEVHMLSGSSFNALLKTLEEPPAHVKFLLATTEPHKLPATVLSRCLHFNLKALPDTVIADRLRDVLTQESMDAEDAALTQLATAAQGSMRDALSLLDQAVAFGGGAVKQDEVCAMLGMPPNRYFRELLQALATQDGKRMIESTRELSAHAPDFAQILDELLTILHCLAVAQTVADLYDADSCAGIEPTLFDRETLQLYYQIALIGKRDLPYAADVQRGFEMILLRMLAFRPATPRTENTATRTSSTSVATDNAKNDMATTAQTDVHADASAQTVVRSPDGNPASHAETVVSDTPQTQQWTTMIQAMRLTGLTRTLAQNCALADIGDDHVRLSLAPQHTALLNDKQRDRLRDALEQHRKRPQRLEITVESPSTETPATGQRRQEDKHKRHITREIENDAQVQSLMQTFSATLHQIDFDQNKNAI